MSKSGTQSKAGTKVSKKAVIRPKKDCVKNAKKTQRVIGKPFSKENQPEKRGRPAGVKDFSTVFDEVSKGKGRAVAVDMLWQKIKDKEFQAIKLAIEYLFEKPKETVVNENRNLDSTDNMTDEEIRAEIERLKAGIL